MSSFYKDFHRKWLEENKDNYNSYEDLTHDFNKTFKCEKSTNALQQFITKRCGIYLSTEKTLLRFTREQENFLVENFHKCNGYEELTVLYNKAFGDSRSVSQISDKCAKRLKLTGMNNKTRYKPGNGKEQCPIGTVRKTTNGATYIKVLNSKSSYAKGYREPWWIPIQKKVYQDEYGEVPNGKMVIFLDGNSENLSIENLYMIDRKISAILAKNGWYSHNAERTLTAIKWCELHYALKNQNERKMKQ